MPFAHSAIPRDLQPLELAFLGGIREGAATAECGTSLARRGADRSAGAIEGIRRSPRTLTATALLQAEPRAGTEMFSFARRTRARIRLGLAGRAETAPGIPIASSIALVIAAPHPTVPPSPAPLTPRGLSGEGASSQISVSTRGTSAAVGCM